jgi:prepilin-type N-terminal cleavage/methylation domain-containing protein
MRQGFTLVEVLVAMVILMVIVLMMANLMRHTSNAWEVGMRNVGVSLEGRTALDLMGRELSAGVMDEMLSDGSIANLSPSFSFYLMGDPDTGSTNRAARLVSYQFSGGVITRSETPLDVANYPMQQGLSGPALPILDGIASFELQAPGGLHTTNMPAWVDLRLELEPTGAANATVKVWSQGRRPADTNGWIQSWRD